MALFYFMLWSEIDVLWDCLCPTRDYGLEYGLAECQASF